MSEDRWQYLANLDESLLQGGVILSEWSSFIVRDADIAFVHGAHLSCIISALAGVESHLRSETESRDKRLVDLINNSGLDPDLTKELHELRKYRNKWVHVSDPLDDQKLLDNPEEHEKDLEEMARRCIIALRRTIYSNPWV